MRERERIVRLAAVVVRAAVGLDETDPVVLAESPETARALAIAARIAADDMTKRIRELERELAEMERIATTYDDIGGSPVLVFRGVRYVPERELSAMRCVVDRFLRGETIESDCIDSQGGVHADPWELVHVLTAERDALRTKVRGLPTYDHHDSWSGSRMERRSDEFGDWIRALTTSTIFSVSTGALDAD